jgi:hypothetical protein
MLTLGTWIGPTIGGIIVAVGVPAGLLRIRTRRGSERERQALAIERLAADAARRMSEGFAYQYRSGTPISPAVAMTLRASSP